MVIRVFPRLAAALLVAAVLARPARAEIQIVEALGNVNVARDEVAAPEAVKKVPYPLQDGSIVRTGASSSAALLFETGTRVVLGAESKFVLASGGSNVKLKLGKGSIRAWVQKLLEGRTFDLETPVAVMAVRGTEFAVTIGERNEVELEVNEGVVAARTVLGEEVLVGDGQALRRLRIVPDRPLDIPGARPPAAPKTPPKSEEKGKGAMLEDWFKQDARREVALAMSQDAVERAAAVEARLAEYQEGKTLIDVFGRRVRLEEYIVRPAPDTFKFVVLNERADSFNYFYYLAQFNQTLPTALAPALRYLNGKTGAAPDFFITAFETGRSNTQDMVRENGTGGHLVNAPLAQASVVYDPGTNSFTTVAAGTPFWSTLFNNYSYKINGTEKYGWQPAAGAVNAYDYSANGFNTRILGGGANCGAAGCATAGPVNCTAQACETAARPSVISHPDGTQNLHDRVTISYAGNGTAETYDFYVVGDAGNLATAADFNGATQGQAYKNTLLKFNFEQTIRATEFQGRQIDLVVEPKILVNSGVIQ